MSVSAEPVSIEHQAVSCVVAGQYPLIDACFSPSEQVARARVYFRGNGMGDWYYVDMKPEEACFRGTLPRPRSSLRTVSYYVAATDRAFEETRTAEFGPVVVKSKGECGDGLVAPMVSSATVLVGALSGTAAPAGFVGGGLLGLGVGTAAAVGVVGAGAVTGAVIAGTGDETTTTTAPQPKPEPTPTPKPTPTPTPEATPTPTPEPTPTPTPEPTPPPLSGSCLDGDSGPPDLTVLSPAANAEVGSFVDISVEVSDPGPVSSGIDLLEITAREQGGSRTGTIATVHSPGPGIQVTWTLPPCLGPQDRWYIDFRAVDQCAKATTQRVRIRRAVSSCATRASESAPAGAQVWTSELSVPDGRGQVVVDGTQAVFPGAGGTPLVLAVAPGTHRVEATLVSGRGPGSWRFALAAGQVRAGSLRIAAGEVASIGPDAVTFHLAGRPGQRVVFTFDTLEPGAGARGGPAASP